MTVIARTNEKKSLADIRNLRTEDNETNGIGFAGFLISVIAFILGWVPILKWVIWGLGIIFSLFGLSKQPKAMAIAGIIISLVGIFFIVFVFKGAKPTF